jgi:hypothetical protein
LAGGTEGIGADAEDGVFRLFVAAQMGADAGQQHGEAEGLGDIVVGARLETQHGVGVGILGRQHDDRRRDPVLA